MQFPLYKVYVGLIIKGTTMLPMKHLKYIIFVGRTDRKHLFSTPYRIVLRQPDKDVFLLFPLIYTLVFAYLYIYIFIYLHFYIYIYIHTYNKYMYIIFLSRVGNPARHQPTCCRKN